MAKLTLETPAETHDALPADCIIQVQVTNLAVKTAKNRDGGEWEKLEFTFEITSIPTSLGNDYQALIGTRIWGSTSLRFVKHVDNKLCQWAEALLGLELDEGFELDTDALIGRRARAVISNYTKKNGEVAHQVKDLLPLVGATATSPASSPQLASVLASFGGFSADEEPPF